jgi:PAS domain-containing protein
VTRFRFVQLDVPGALGLDEGRYLAHGDGDSRTVLVVQNLGVPAPRGMLRRRPRAREADPEAAPDVPLTRLTVVLADKPLEDAAEASRWLDGAGDEEAQDLIADALRTVNKVLHTQGVATWDPAGSGVSAERAAAVRIGYGSGEDLADGAWERAMDVPYSEPRRRRQADALRPQERLAAVLTGREDLDACETLLLRARADLDQGRLREAALQLSTGLAALLAELPGRAGPDQEEDLATLEERRATTEAAAGEALRGAISEERAGELAETLAVCERVLRRRRILGSSD